MASADSFASGNLVEIAVGVGDVREPLFWPQSLALKGMLRRCMGWSRRWPVSALPHIFYAEAEKHGA